MHVLPTLGLLLFESIFVETLFTYRLPISNQVKATLGYPRDNLLNFTELAGKYGYNTESHIITTEDGYISQLFRLNHPKCILRTPPVILAHGFLQVSDSWLDSRPNSLAFLLADACYDLWFCNTRGNYYARAHKFLNPDVDDAFWNFSIDEVGYYDIPTIIDNVLNKTAAKKVNFIGYSQGGGALLITLAEYPEYNEKINLNILLAPAVQLTNMKSLPFRLTAQLIFDNENLLRRIGIQELFFKGSLIQEFIEFVCQLRSEISRWFCTTVIAVFDGFDPDSISNRTLRRMFAHLPAGVNVQSFIKYHQTIRTGGFPKYDYGPTMNLQRYGNVTAPSFNLTNVKVPTVLFTGRNDNLIASEDVVWLSNQLSNVLELIVVNSTFWDHFDIGYSRFVPTLLFPNVNEYLLRYSEVFNSYLSRIRVDTN